MVTLVTPSARRLQRNLHGLRQRAAIGQPGYAVTPEGHLHAACLEAADADDGEPRAARR